MRVSRECGEWFARLNAELHWRGLSQVANMPAGIADTLRAEQILDLIAYLIANGDADHRVVPRGAPRVRASGDQKG